MEVYARAAQSKEENRKTKQDGAMQCSAGKGRSGWLEKAEAGQDRTKSVAGQRSAKPGTAEPGRSI